MSDFLRNYKEHVARLKKNRMPEVLTVNGRAEVVMLDTESYEDLMDQLHKSQATAVQAKLHQWQKETETETFPAVSAHQLFSRWAEEDAQMTDEEKEAEDYLWQDFEKGVNETRAVLGMRQI
jgi:PHD/YefM family antitoxin component YafN of YafNO toxin-antitoxin module